ncbi:MAG: hypothetical protein GY705_06000 [Bacteroidetes bacterium]|nr:hypothetical protein [Bacteroidota bacterium]
MAPPLRGQSMQPTASTSDKFQLANEIGEYFLTESSKLGPVILSKEDQEALRLESPQSKSHVHRKARLSESEPKKRWRASISHPAKSNLDNTATTSMVLTHGIDSLYLSMNVQWIGRSFFDRLEERQWEAKLDDKPMPIDLYDSRKVDAWTGLVQPFGRRGYQWIMVGKEYQMSIGN